MAEQGRRRAIPMQSRAIEFDKLAIDLVARFLQFNFIDAPRQERFARTSRPHQQHRRLRLDRNALGFVNHRIETCVARSIAGF